MEQKQKCVFTSIAIIMLILSTVSSFGQFNPLKSAREKKAKAAKEAAFKKSEDEIKQEAKSNQNNETKISGIKCYDFNNDDPQKIVSELLEAIYRNESVKLSIVDSINWNEAMRESKEVYKSKLYELIVRYKREFYVLGDSVIYKQPYIKQIYFTAPSAAVDKLVSNYFEPIINPCNPKKSPTWFFWNDKKLVYSDYNSSSVPKKFIEIEIQ